MLFTFFLPTINNNFSQHTNCALFIPSPSSPCRILSSITHLLETIHPILSTRLSNPHELLPSHFSPSTASFLLSLPSSALSLCDQHGPVSFLLSSARNSSLNLPSDLLYLAQQTQALQTSFPLITNPPTFNSKPNQSLRKSVQIESLTPLIHHLVNNSCISAPKRIIDFGAGRAHLAAHLANTISPSIPVIALDNNPKLLQAAYTLYKSSSENPSLSFHHADALQFDSELVSSNDFILGLHPCGVLGDKIIQTAISNQVTAILLVSCCLQKIPSTQSFRQPLSNIVKSNTKLLNTFQLPRAFLGVANRPSVQTSTTSLKNMVARRTRYALRAILNHHGIKIRPGEEVYGLSRHQLKKGLYAVNEQFAQIRQIKPLSETEINYWEEIAAKEYDMLRRLAIPRAIAGQILEMAIVLDRAAALEEADCFSNVALCRTWPEDISVRNLCCMAWR